MTKEISIKQIKSSKTETFSKKDNSIRGCATICKKEVKIGDLIVINNYFTLVTE